MEKIVLIFALIDIAVIIIIMTYTLIETARERKEYINKYYHTKRFALNNLPMEKYNELDEELKNIK